MAQPQFKHISVKESGGVAVVEFVDAQLMYEMKVVDEVGAELSSLFTDHNYTNVILDFRNVQYLSSTILGKLAKLEQQAHQAKGKLKMCGLGPVLMDTFRIGHFDRVFDVHDDVESALKTF
jgi:anti-sigma B factor antagonist